MTKPKAKPATYRRSTDRLIRVYPHPDLVARSEYLAGIGVDGAVVDQVVADELLFTGSVVLRRPAAVRSSEG